MSEVTRPPIFVVLLHSPMLNRKGEEVTTAVTNMDLHDIARSCRTFGVTRYYVVNPETSQEDLVENILSHWKEEVSQIHHPLRARALDLISYQRTFTEALEDAKRMAPEFKPFVVMPDAKDLPQALAYQGLRRQFLEGEFLQKKQSLLLVFGTGWGISPQFYAHVDAPLKPIKGPDTYNHLSVRAAVAIVLDRLFGN